MFGFFTCSRLQPLRRLLSAALSLLLVALGTSSCADTDGPAVCTVGAVGAITIGSGLTPTISWGAPCPALALSVYPTATGLPTWQLATGTRLIPKPLTYGTTIPGVTIVHPPETLQAGVEYGVLIQLAAPHGDTVSSVGTFTP